VAGGVLCVVGVAVCALALPAFRRYDARTWAPDGEPDETAAAAAK
jgi:hypothetical protein